MTTPPTEQAPEVSPSRKTQTASKRLSSASSRRLQTITETPPAPVPPIPAKSDLRSTAANFSLPKPRNLLRFPRPSSGDRPSVDSPRSAPPAYELFPGSAALDDRESLQDGPVEGEKLAALRRSGGYVRQRFGCGRRSMCLTAAVLLVLVVIALAVGLGVGLTVGKQNNSDSDSSGSGPSSGSRNDTNQQPFPLGKFSMITALRNIATDCTSNPATWRCHPDVVYDSSDPSSMSASVAILNWALANTSQSYATINSGSTPDAGIPANLSVSSIENPFGVNFADTHLTYISSSSNSSSARYTFDFTMDQTVFPTMSITTDNSAAKCFFNHTTFTATLYLSAPRTYPGSVNISTSGGFTEWPYAIEVKQTIAGGQDVPSCYEYSNGDVGSPITTGLTAQPQTSQCACDYRNY